MKKRNPSKTSVVSRPPASHRADGFDVVTGNGSFTFINGDKYSGEYKIFGEPPCLVKHGRGIYYTEDFDKYDCVWNADRIGEDPRISFNNGTEYVGGLDENGRMSGRGTYFLPDGSSITAEWFRNKLSRHIRYKEPLGFTWKAENPEDGKEVRFTAGNHFWGDMIVPEKGESRASGE